MQDSPGAPAQEQKSCKSWSGGGFHDLHEINQSVKKKKYKTLRTLLLSCVAGFQVPGKDGLSVQVVLAPSPLALGLKLAAWKEPVGGSIRDPGWVLGGGPESLLRPHMQAAPSKCSVGNETVRRLLQVES